MKASCKSAHDQIEWVFQKWGFSETADLQQTVIHKYIHVFFFLIFKAGDKRLNKYMWHEVYTALWHAVLFSSRNTPLAYGKLFFLFAVYRYVNPDLWRGSGGIFFISIDPGGLDECINVLQFVSDALAQSSNENPKLIFWHYISFLFSLLSHRIQIY